MDRNEMHFHLLVLFYFWKERTVYKHQKQYVPFMEMVSKLRVLFISIPLFSELKYREYSSRPVVIDDDQIKMLIKNNPVHLTQEMAEIFHILYMIILRHMKSVGYMNHDNIWYPHDLMERFNGLHFYLVFAATKYPFFEKNIK